MGIFRKFVEKAGRVAPAVMGLTMIAGVGMMALTGNAAAADTNTTASIIEQYSILTFVAAGMGLVFGAATLYLKDWRAAIASLLCLGVAFGSAYLGF